MGRGNSILSPRVVARNFHRNGCKSGQASDGEIRRIGKRSKLILALIRYKEDLSQILSSLSNTVADCPDLFRPGLFHPDNSLVFYLLINETDIAEKMTSFIFDMHYIKKHPKVVVFYHTERNLNPFLVRYNIYQNQLKLTVVQDQTTLQGIVNDFPMQVCF